MPGGRLHLVTDWIEYAQQMQQVLNNTRNLKFLTSQKPHYRPMTKYEKRANKLNHIITDLVYMRV